MSIPVAIRVCDGFFSAGVVPALTMAAALMLTDWPLAVQRGHSSDARPGLPYSMEGQ
jgi:TRAP-type C4-dicarboxylate transport system permease large subunit